VNPKWLEFLKTGILSVPDDYPNNPWNQYIKTTAPPDRAAVLVVVCLN